MVLTKIWLTKIQFYNFNSFHFQVTKKRVLFSEVIDVFGNVKKVFELFKYQLENLFSFNKLNYVVHKISALKFFKYFN